MSDLESSEKQVQGVRLAVVVSKAMIQAIQVHVGL